MKYESNRVYIYIYIYIYIYFTYVLLYATIGHMQLILYGA